MCRNDTLMRAIEDLSQNITISIFSLADLTQVPFPYQVQPYIQTTFISPRSHPSFPNFIHTSNLISFDQVPRCGNGQHEFLPNTQHVSIQQRQSHPLVQRWHLHYSDCGLFRTLFLSHEWRVAQHFVLSCNHKYKEPRSGHHLKLYE